MESWQFAVWIAVALLAVLIGVIIPVLAQVRATHKTAQVLMDRLAPQVEHVLREAEVTTERVNRATAELEPSVAEARKAIHAAGEIGYTIHRVTHGLRTAALVSTAVAPAVSAAVKAFAEYGGRQGSRASTDGRTAAAPEAATHRVEYVERVDPSTAEDPGVSSEKKNDAQGEGT